MSAVNCPHCGEPINMFGSGGGQFVAEALTKELGKDVKLLGRIPFDVRLRESGDNGEPLVLSDPSAPASEVMFAIADQLASKPRGLVGRPLQVAPA
jgi:ATP-binding protein involved in chromosome partitioning